MNKKYEFTDETTEVDGHTLHRIRAVRCFSDVKAGDIGGWVEKEDNLSKMGDAWVYENAEVYGNAKVHGDAEIYCNAKVFGNAKVYENARVYGNAILYGYTLVCGNANVYGNAWVFGKSKVYGNARICDNAKVYGKAIVHGDSEICDDTIICGKANIFNADINGNAKVASTSDYIVFKNWWSSGRYFTWTRSNNMWSVGCFYGTGEELIAKAYKDSELSGREYKRVVKYVESIINEDKI